MPSAGARPALLHVVRWIAIVVMLAARAWSSPFVDGKCSTREPAMFAARAGIEHAGVGGYRVHPPVYTTAPAGELEGGVWVTDDAALTAVVGSYTRVQFSNYGTPWGIALGNVGARLAFAPSGGPVFFAAGAGATLESTREATTRDRSVSHYGELVLGGTVARTGPIAFQLTGELSWGELTNQQATLGIAWDPPRPRRCAITPPQGLTAAVRVGPAYTDVIFSGDEPRGWGPWLEAELGGRMSPHWALVAFAAYTHFSDDVLVQDIGTKVYPVHYDVTHLRFGGRAQLWLAPRVFAALGTGVEWDNMRPAGEGSPFFELELGFELLKVGPVAVELTDLADISQIGATTGFSLGVAYR